MSMRDTLSVSPLVSDGIGIAEPEERRFLQVVTDGAQSSFHWRERLESYGQRVQELVGSTCPQTNTFNLGPMQYVESPRLVGKAVRFENSSKQFEEGIEHPADEVEIESIHEKGELQMLQNALTKCWTLCNCFESLLSTQHKCMSQKHIQDPDEHAWRACWNLCQQLYIDWCHDLGSLNLKLELDLLRNLCQALFDTRHPADEDMDSILRTSFGLNNHLYSTQHGGLPDHLSFRTLDMYISLCQQLLRHRVSTAGKSERLLNPCWSLAEMFISLQRHRRESKKSDMELLSIAIQGCWELCSVLEKSWVQATSCRRDICYRR